MSSKDTDPLADRTNTAPNGRRAAKPAGKTINDELQEAIPSAKLVKKRAPRKVATQGQVDELNARIAELEAAAAAQDSMPPPTAAVLPPPVKPAPPRRAAPAPKPPVATPTAPSARKGRPPPQSPRNPHAARNVVQECVRRADMDLAVFWNEQPLETRLIVINAAKEKMAYFRRMEKDWATKRLAMQFLKNRRGDAYKKGSLERPAKYDYLVANSALRSTSGSRVKKAKLHLAARLAKRARDQEREEEEEEEARRRRKRARQAGARTDDSQPEFVEG
ncbi:hypothetical protein R3P38DRAFT_2815615 [Favolaschia claudopus]|uniref:Uncharacterized protein n=1 Tax=Favolaschia claudopus TaxID=2862362 RepID=A0AAV9Z119_9AGAR